MLLGTVATSCSHCYSASVSHLKASKMIKDIKYFLVSLFKTTGETTKSQGLFSTCDLYFFKKKKKKELHKIIKTCVFLKKS